MAVEAAGSASKIQLIPWDPTNEQHAQRLYEQRVACTWDYESIPQWKDQVLRGDKFMYWIIISDDLPGSEELLALHVEKCPKESEPLTDTATLIANSARTPTYESFLPIGHIALQKFPEKNEKFSLHHSSLWVKSFYISWAIQAGGFGRSAMARLECLATLAPLNATAIALDTIAKESQLEESSLQALYDYRGLQRPAVIRTNEEWYLRQGYEIFARSTAEYTWTSPVTGETHPIPAVYMMKPLVVVDA